MMTQYSISKKFFWQGPITEKAAAAMRMFGLSADRLTEGAINHNCQLEIRAGDIVYITGPSGAGKSVLLKELMNKVPDEKIINLNGIELPVDKMLIDCVKGDFLHSLKVLSLAGLNDIYCVLNTPGNLSDGQKYRFRLAMALAAKKQFIFADEFCSNLDRVTAAVISHNVRKFADKHNVTFILASSHDDILVDLAPDVIVTRQLSGPAQVIYKNHEN